jgi:hypothetical protein
MWKRVTGGKPGHKVGERNDTVMLINDFHYRLLGSEIVHN